LHEKIYRLQIVIIKIEKAKLSGKSLLIDQMYKTYAEGMAEENLKLKCVTGGKLHRSFLTFYFECDDLHHQFRMKRIHNDLEF